MARIGIDARLTHYRVGGISRYITSIISAIEAKPTEHNLIVFQSRKASVKLSERLANARLWTPPHHAFERATLSIELLPHRLDLLAQPRFYCAIPGG